MIFQSRLSRSAYPTADPRKHLKGDTKNLDPVVAGRLAYLAKMLGIVIEIDDGYRSLADQWKMWKLYKAGKLKATAAEPGTSWHGSGLAADINDYKVLIMTNAQLKQYGLCKPLSKEPWHIQPIETAKMGAKCNMSLAPIDLVPQLKAKFGIGDISTDYISNYDFALEFTEALLAGKKKYEKSTIDYMSKYEHWNELKIKLELQVA